MIKPPGVIFRLKCLKVRFRLQLCPRPRWGSLYSALPDPLAGGEGASRPLRKNPTPASAFGLDFRPLRPQTSAPSAPRCPPKYHYYPNTGGS